MNAESPLDSAAGRIALSFVRLAVDDNDNLAWRTLLKVRKNSIGPTAIALIVDAVNPGGTFSAALGKVAQDKGPLKKELTSLLALLAQVKAVVGKPNALLTPEQIQASLAAVSKVLEEAGVTGLQRAASYMADMAARSEAATFQELLGVLSMVGLTPEQETAKGAVNMLTMHKAKGLSARAVMIMACEDEYLPGRQQAIDQEADERRLLYVSLTRAKQRLYVTYAQRRTGQQQHTGRDSGKQKRTLTRYLRNAPIHVIPAPKFFEALGKD